MTTSLGGRCNACTHPHHETRCLVSTDATRKHACGCRVTISEGEFAIASFLHYLDPATYQRPANV